MFRIRFLPWEYGVRNLLRRPVRSALTFVALAAVVLLVLAVVGFIRGLESSLARSGNPRVALVFSRGMGENLEYSSVPMRTSDLLAASLQGVQRRYGERYVSPELYLGTQVDLETGGEPAFGLVRGVTPAALLVHNQVQLVSGRWPEAGEILVGRLAGTKLGSAPGRLEPGRSLDIEGRTWRISGVFSAGGSTFESEIWCRLDDLQQALKRQDLSLVALTLRPDADFADVELFCAERLDLELQTMRQVEYFATLQRDYGPVRQIAWLMVWLVGGAGVFCGLNTMYGAVAGRVRELATLQTIGFLRRAIVLSLVQEGTILAAAASLAAAAVAVVVFREMAVRFTMSAVELRMDGPTLLIGCGIGLSLGVLGSLPPAARILRLPVVDGLKSV
jgi:ABC-type antimicrobial peptide transport system permease subunit